VRRGRNRGSAGLRARRRAKREAEKAAKEAEDKLKLIELEKMPSPKWEPEVEIENPYIPQKPTTKPASKFKNVLGWIKEHVRPDVGLTPFNEGEGPDWGNDSLHEISGKLKQNLRVGLKITWRF
jgi:hypothetical protein